VLRALAPLLLALAAPALSNTPMPPPKPFVLGEVHTLNSDVLGQPRNLAVRLPSGYGKDPKARYPVVYVIDGGVEQDFPHLAGLAQSADVNGTFEPFILVGIETVKRREEITPAVKDPAPYIAELGQTPGGAARFRRFIAQEVKPYVDGQFRTNGEDALMGESLAGLFVIDTLFEAPDLFDDYIAVSPSLWWDNMKHGREASDRLKRLPAGQRRLYLTLADEGYRHEQGVNLLVAALKRSAPVNLQWLYVPQGDTETHASIYHGAALDAWRAFYGTPSRIYLPGALLAGRPMRERTAAEDARRGRECSRAVARRVTPADTRPEKNPLTYECLLYDLGPRATEGRFDR
jgi:hypothetical protein